MMSVGESSADGFSIHLDDIKKMKKLNMILGSLGKGFSSLDQSSLDYSLENKIVFGKDSYIKWFQSFSFKQRKIFLSALEEWGGKKIGDHWMFVTSNEAIAEFIVVIANTSGVSSLLAVRNKGLEKARELKAILKARDYMNDRSPSIKQLLEFVALSL